MEPPTAISRGSICGRIKKKRSVVGGGTTEKRRNV